MQKSSSFARIRKLTVTALLTAIIWLLTFTPIGFTIPFFGLGMTFVHIPMIVGTMMEGLGVGTVLGGMFGLASLFKNTTQPASIYSPMLQNPLISVLPRLLIAPMCYLVLLLSRRLFPGKRKLQYTIAAVSGALFNTLFTLSAFSINLALNPGAAEGATYASIWALTANCPIECVSAALVSVAVMTALDKIYKRNEG